MTKQNERCTVRLTIFGICRLVACFRACQRRRPVKHRGDLVCRGVQLLSGFLCIKLPHHLAYCQSQRGAKCSSLSGAWVRWWAWVWVLSVLVLVLVWRVWTLQGHGSVSACALAPGTSGGDVEEGLRVPQLWPPLQVTHVGCGGLCVQA